MFRFLSSTGPLFVFQWLYDIVQLVWTAFGTFTIPRELGELTIDPQKLLSNGTKLRESFNRTGGLQWWDCYTWWYIFSTILFIKFLFVSLSVLCLLRRVCLTPSLQESKWYFFSCCNLIPRILKISCLFSLLAELLRFIWAFLQFFLQFEFGRYSAVTDGIVVWLQWLADRQSGWQKSKWRFGRLVPVPWSKLGYLHTTHWKQLQLPTMQWDLPHAWLFLDFHRLTQLASKSLRVA